MAPRMKLRCMRKGGNIEGESSQRRPANQTILDSAAFKSDAMWERFSQHISYRKIEIGKRLTSEWCSMAGLDTHQLFKNIGWSEFLGCDELCYPALVKIFYTHLKIKDNFQIESYVRGKEISLEYRDLQDIFKVNVNPEFQYYETNGWPRWTDEEACTALKQMCIDQNITTRFKPEANQLTVQARLIHHVICLNILPRAGHYDKVSYMDIYLIWCVLNGKKVSLPYLVMRHMQDCLNSRVGHLPYGRTLTMLFKKLKIPLKEEGEKRPRVWTDTYTNQTLKKMKFVQTADGWIREGEGVPEQVCEEDGRQIGEDASDDSSEDLPIGTHAHRGRLRRMLTGIRELSIQMGNRFDRIDTRLDHMDDQINNIRSDVTTIRDDLNDLKNKYQSS